MSFTSAPLSNGPLSDHFFLIGVAGENERTFLGADEEVELFWHGHFSLMVFIGGLMI